MATVCYNSSLLKVCYDETNKKVCTTITPPGCGIAECECGSADCGSNTPQCLKLTVAGATIETSCESVGGGLYQQWDNLPDINTEFILENTVTNCCVWKLIIDLETSVTRYLYNNSSCTGSPISSTSWAQMIITASYTGGYFHVVICFGDGGVTAYLAQSYLISADELTDCGTVEGILPDTESYPHPYPGGTASTERY